MREAMHPRPFPAEFINQTLNAGSTPRITSYFANSPLRCCPDPPKDGVGGVSRALSLGDLLPGAETEG